MKGSNAALGCLQWGLSGSANDQFLRLDALSGVALKGNQGETRSRVPLKNGPHPMLCPPGCFCCGLHRDPKREVPFDSFGYNSLQRSVKDALYIYISPTSMGVSLFRGCPLEHHNLTFGGFSSGFPLNQPKTGALAPRKETRHSYICKNICLGPCRRARTQDLTMEKVLRCAAEHTLEPRGFPPPSLFARFERVICCLMARRGATSHFNRWLPSEMSHGAKHAELGGTSSLKVQISSIA